MLNARAAQASGTVLEQLRGSAVSSRLLALAQGPAPLPLVGQWLSEVGQCVAKVTRQVRASNTCTKQILHNYLLVKRAAW
jgi:hypothetical protein